MNARVSSNRNERGVALPLALFALVMLSGLLLVFVTMAGMEPQVAANLTGTAQARYVADAGIEWAYDQLVLNPSNWNQFLATNGGTMASKMTLPGLGAVFGTFTVTVRNDFPAVDPQTGKPFQEMTGQPFDATGTATTDNNHTVILTATGSLPNGTTRQIQAVVGHIPFAVGGVFTFTTPQPKVDLPGNMTINGNDTKAGSTKAGDGSCAPTYAMTIAPGPPGNEAAFEATLNPAQLQTGKKATIKGKAQDTSKAGEGVNTIAEDSTLTSKQVTDFVNAIKGRADIQLTSTPTDPLVYSNNQAGGKATKGQDGSIGASCATDWNSATCWGTAAKPKVVYVSAQTPNVNQPFQPASLQVSDIQGAGILIVENGTLFLNGAPGWQGIIIVSGKNVGFQICCGQIHEVWGTIVVNETSTADPVANWETTAGQHSDLYYSCEAINNALNTRAATRLASWREL